MTGLTRRTDIRGAFWLLSRPGWAKIALEDSEPNLPSRHDAAIPHRGRQKALQMACAT